MGDDDEFEHHQGVLLIFLAALRPSGTVRERFYVRNRIEWDDHVAELQMESPQAFSQLYRMNLRTFNELCSWIDPFVKVDPVMSHVRTGKPPIVTEVALHCLLRWLAGGSHLDIRMSAGISVASFYACIYKCVDAVLQCNQLAISFPSNDEEVSVSARHFQSLSSSGVIDGCVGCLDGMLLSIRAPSPDETGNVRAYFSGHYA